jgi:hypothetical protein
MTAVLPRFETPASKRSSERSGDNGGGEPVRSAPAGTRWTGDVPSRDETDAVPLLTDCSRGVVAVEETTGVDDPHPMRATVNYCTLQKPKGPKRLKIEPDRSSTVRCVMISRFFIWSIIPLIAIFFFLKIGKIGGGQMVFFLKIGKIGGGQMVFFLKIGKIGGGQMVFFLKIGKIGGGQI